MNRKLPVALQLFSIRDMLVSDFDSALAAVASAGYDGVEFAGLYGHSTEEVLAMLEKHKLRAASAHVSIDEMLADPDGVMSCYAALGCRYIAVPFLEEHNIRIGGKGYEITLGCLAALAQTAKAHGLTLMYHNHDFEFATVNGEYVLDMLYSAVPALAVELDTCWAAVAGVDPAEYIRKYAARCPVIHLKDFELCGKKPQNIFGIMGRGGDAEDENGRFGFRPCGHGMLNIPAILAAADASAAEWLVVEQDAPSLGKSAIECARMSAEYLKSVI